MTVSPSRSSGSRSPRHHRSTASSPDDLVTGQPLIEQIAQRHARACRRRLRDLPTELSRLLIAASSSSAEPVNITCLPVTGSSPPKSRTWYVPPRCRMPVRSFGPCFLHAMRASVSSRIGQPVGQRSTKITTGNRSTVQKVTRDEVEPSTFRFSGLRCSVRFRSAPSATCAGAASR